MCGLFCIISKKQSGFSEKELSIFTQGLFADTLRGEDSTGVFSVTNEGNVHTLKEALPGPMFTKHQEYEDFLTNQYSLSRILVGHNRSATRGLKTDKNAHPFVSNNTVLVHNGTLHQHHHLAQTSTDSEAICIALDKKDNPIDLLSELDGAFALIWYNAKTKQFHVSRNKERPLWILETPDFDLIGSESKMIEWISCRNTGKDIEAKYFQENHLYTWELDKLKDGFETVTKFEKKKISSPTFQTRKTIKTIGNIGTNKPIEIIPNSNLFYSKPIKIEISSFTPVNEHVKILGKCTNFPEVDFQCTIHQNLCPDLYFQKEIIVYPHGKMTQFGNTIVYCTYDYHTLNLTTIDNKHVSLAKEQQTCSSCKNNITKEDNNDIWIRFTKHNTVKTILCPTCVSNNENLYLRYQVK